MPLKEPLPYLAPGISVDEIDSELANQMDGSSLPAKKNETENKNESEIQPIDAGRLPPVPHFLKNPIKALFWLIRASFGMLSLVILLAVIAAIPIINLYSLGYLLDVQGRVGRTGKFRNAFPLLDVAPRFGAIALGIWIWIFPLRILSGAAIDAHVLSPGSGNDLMMTRLVSFLSFAVFIHLAMALARGGSLSCFFRPIKNFRWLLSQWKDDQYFDQATEHIKLFVSDLRIRHYFSLGFRGAAGAAIWLFPPTFLFAYSTKVQSENPDFWITVIGGFLLAIVLCWLPALQTRFAVENRFKAFFELKHARTLMAKRPLLWVLVLLLTYAMSLPLNLFKVVTPDQDAMWFITLIFIIGIYPTKVMLGWLYHFSEKKENLPRKLWRWPVGWVGLPIVFFYVFLLFFTQFIGEQGKLILFQNHVFLLPIPF